MGRASVVMAIVVRCGERNFGRYERLVSSSCQLNSRRWRGKAGGVPSGKGSTSRVSSSESLHSRTSSRRIHEAYILSLRSSRTVSGRRNAYFLWCVSIQDADWMSTEDSRMNGDRSGAS